MFIKTPVDQVKLDLQGTLGNLSPEGVVRCATTSSVLI